MDVRLFVVIVGALLVGSVLFWHDPLPLAAIVAFVLLFDHEISQTAGVRTVRSFFAVSKIWESPNGRYRLLTHGTTLHGGQLIRNENGKPVTGRPVPTAYYFDGSGMTQVIDAAHDRSTPIRYAVIGLGTGSLACRAEPGDTVDFYEIDPTVMRIATNSENFSFLSECGPVSITLGDARLTLAEAPDESYDTIIVDAFASDAIPIHLITREAMAIYRRKLAPRGIVAIHVSNRNLELASVVAGIAAANDMVSRVNNARDVRQDDANYIFPSTVVAAARADEDFGPLAQSGDWEAEPHPIQRVWTDDYSNVVGAILRRLEPTRLRYERGR